MENIGYIGCRTFDYVPSALTKAIVAIVNNEHKHIHECRELHTQNLLKLILKKQKL